MTARGTLSASWAAVAVITAAFAVIAWAGVEQFRSSGGGGEVAHRAFSVSWSLTFATAF